jgi:hypothetical protein
MVPQMFSVSAVLLFMPSLSRDQEAVSSAGGRAAIRNSLMCSGLT